MNGIYILKAVLELDVVGIVIRLLDIYF